MQGFIWDFVILSIIEKWLSKVWLSFVHQEVVGPNLLILSCWWSWAPQLSRLLRPARFEPPIFRTRSSGDTIFFLLFTFPDQENMLLILPSSIKWPNQNLHPHSNSHCHPANSHMGPDTTALKKMEKSWRRDWRTVTGGTRKGKKRVASVIKVLRVCASAMCDEAETGSKGRDGCQTKRTSKQEKKMITNKLR